MKITLLYAGLLALWFVVLSARVIMGRSGPGKPSLGDGGSLEMQRRIRGHANFTEYVPLSLILLALLEFSGVAAWMLHGLGAMLLLGRLMHGWALSFTANSPVGRAAGIGLTLLSLTGAAVLCLGRVAGLV
jgi:uncharacterized membrane protein YecN with MAPEG domain